MTARTLLSLFAFLAANAFALPVQLQFTSVARSNQDVATSAVNADFKTDQSPPSGLPLITEALAVGQTDFAAASSINAAGLLNTSAEADSNSGFASADASAEFIGNFVGRNMMEVRLGFLIPSNVQDGINFAGANLFVTVTSMGNTLFSNVFTAGGPLDLFINVPYGAPGTLDILLESAANVLTGGSAFNEAGVSIDVSVPEPSTYMLVALGIILVLLTRRPARRAALAASLGPVN